MPRRRTRVRTRRKETSAPLRLEGIDVSRHQGVVNWGQVAASGITYCFIKATQGATLTDPRFVENWRNAGSHGITRGAYHFFSPGVAVARQVQHFSNVVQLSAGDLAPVLDLEVDGQDWDALPPDVRVPAALEMLTALEAHYGVTPIVYTNKRTVVEAFAGKPRELVRFPLWVASYRSTPPPTMPPGWTAWKFWQYTDQGRVPGISGNVDRNRCTETPGPLIVAPSETVDVAAIAPPSTARPSVLVPEVATTHALAIFDHVWERVTHDARSGLFPDGLAEASVDVAVEPSGSATFSVKLRRTPSPTPVVETAAPTLELAPVSAIDLAAPLPAKVLALWNLIDIVVEQLDGSRPPAMRRIVKTFLMHVAAHESELRTRRQSASGPARGLFQFEAHRAKDAGAHARKTKLTATLASVCGNTVAELHAAFDALPTFNRAHASASAFFPAGNLIEARLLDNDLFAAYLIRIDFRRFNDPIPASNREQADYWFRFWKGSGANPASLKKKFVEHCAMVDPHIPF
jgi:lysozyme